MELDDSVNAGLWTRMGELANTKKVGIGRFTYSIHSFDGMTTQPSAMR
jgi:hypothetical protein